MKKYSILLLALFAMACSRHNNTLQNGIWRAALHRGDGHNIVFNFSVKDSLNKKVIYIINGSDRMLVDSVRQEGDSVFITMPFFNSDFKAKIQEDGSLKGEWVKHLPQQDNIIPFTATPNTNYRFEENPVSTIQSASGRWATDFISENGKDTTKAVGEFEQQDNKVTGTFLTETGDYRFLQGIVSGDTLKLSTFDGSHVYLFTAIISDDSLRNGHFYASATYHENWQAHKDANAALPNAFAITHMKKGDQKLNFTYPDLQGKPVSIDDKQFKNKVVIIQIMGSWCPNCMDETKFLSKYYKQYKKEDLAIVGLAYERTTDFKESKAGLETFKKRFDVQYPMLITGVTASDPDKMQKTLPQITNFISFPTTIFLNKEGEVSKIHAGFSGPGTGEHFIQFKQEFNHIVDSLM